MKKSLISQIKISKLKNKKLLIGVSGGIDSMSLLHFLTQNKSNFAKIGVIHVNYKQRLDVNYYEKKIVENFCLKHNLSFYYFEYENNLSSSKNFQTNAREYRYLKANEIYNKFDFDLYLTAHNLNDFLETYFIKKIQNRGQQNLTIKQNANFDKMPIYRLFLFINKNQIQDYAKLFNVIWNDDISNFTNKYLRNRIRKKINYLEMSNLDVLYIWKDKILQKEQENLKNSIDIFNVSITKLKLLDDFVLKKSIYYSLNKYFIFKRKGFVNEVIKLINQNKNNAKLDLGDNKLLVKEGEFLKIFVKQNILDQSLIINRTPGIYKFNNKKISINTNLKTPLILRYYQKNDKILKKEGNVWLRKEFINKKIPTWKRLELIVIEQNTKIIFVEEIYEKIDCSILN